jgi:DNA mismatch repair protein MutL
VSRVRVLPDDLANQIAAGEVVERPSSVVKELMENALDAGARRVRVDIEGGGTALIRVADDGSGMEHDDARLAVLRHATSKIGHIDDLRSITSFGFRGEALPSIASVSRFALRTRRAEDHEGTLVRIEGGGAIEVSPCGCATGTVVEVRELFYNVPARRKFLRAVTTESAHVTEVVQAVALGEPAITVVLSRDGRIVREWLRAQGREDRVRGALAGEDLAACRGERGPLGVEAFLSRPERARSGATGLSIFVNGRCVRDRALARAVAMAYGSVLEMGRYPVGVVFLDLPHELVDVNVHPQKAEVRFADGRAVADALYKIVAPGLSTAFGLPAPTGSGWAGRTRKQAPGAPPDDAGWVWSDAPPIDLESAGRQGSIPMPDPSYLGEDFGAQALGPRDFRGASTNGSSPGVSPSERSGDPTSASLKSSPAASGLSVDAGDAGSSLAEHTQYPTAAEVSAASDRPGGSFQTLRFVAQVRGMFLICEGRDGLYIVDQHAAAERVTFCRLRRAFIARDVAIQKLLFPVIVTVTPSEVALVEEAQPEIERAGFDVRPAGPSQIAVHAVPLLLTRASPERLARDLLGELGHSGSRAFSGAIDLVLATMACHGSIRAGDAVSPEEARALLAALDDVDFAGHCPHGRPIVMRVSYSELEHRVGRR